MSIGQNWMQTGDYPDARNAFVQALAAYEKSEDLKGMANVLVELGSPDFFEDEYGQSIASNQRALEIYEKTGDRMGQAAALKGLGITWMFTDDCTARVRQAVDWLTRRHGPSARVFAIAFCREVHTYLAKPDSPRRAAVRDEVAAVIAEHRPSVVVAHSLGSVVAYETLWHHSGPPIDLLITVGSPLAMPGVVLERLRPTSNSRPPGVRRWVNLADAGDLVAVPRGGLGARFAEVQDEDDVTIGPWDFHTARRYLRTPEVRALIDTA